jgi:GT2 family glycosyltransferase
VAFLDGDDYWGPDHLAKQMQLLSEDPRLDLVYCDCVLVKNDKPLARAFSLEPQASQVTFDTILLEECAIGTSTVVVSRDALLRAGLFDEAFRRCEDFELWLRLAFGGSHIAYHSDAEVFHRVWEQGLSADRLSMKKDRIRVYEKLAASLPLSEQQHSTLDRLTAETRRDCDLDVLKVLLGARDYSKALLVAQRAQAQSSSWKIRVATLGLRFMPRLFGSLFRLRKRMVRDLFHDARLSHHGLLSNDDIAANDTPFVESSADREELQGISSGP